MARSTKSAFSSKSLPGTGLNSMRPPVLIISTQSSERDRARGLSLGANGYLIKPFSQEVLQTEVWRLLPSGIAHAKPHG